MSKKIFPTEILNFTIESEIARNSTRSQIIYSVTLLFLFAGFALLPFIQVDISIQSRGIIRPKHQISEIISPVQGRLEKLFFYENDMVRKGDTLLTINAARVVNNLQYTKERQSELQSYSSDLKLLLKILSPSAFNPVHSLTTANYQRQHREFTELINKANRAYLKAKQDYNRSKQLYEGAAISLMEFEKAQFELDNAHAELKALHLSQLTQWSEELKNHETELNRIESEFNKIREEQKDFVIIAPLSGSIQELKGLAPGMQILASQSLLKISPDSGLMVETFIVPGDIGFIKPEQPVTFQVDAFNYNQWGFATGSVIEIAHDITLRDNQPFFRVTCSVDQTHLSLKNGYSGSLKKGMTLNSRFIITQRSLWQLLYDKVDNWLNPKL